MGDKPGEPQLSAIASSRKSLSRLIVAGAFFFVACAGVEADQTAQTPGFQKVKRVSILDFCRRDEISRDITACAQRAVDAAGNTNASFGGGRIFFPAQFSPYVLRGTLTLATSFVGLEGEGPQASFITCANGAQDCIAIGAADKTTRDQSIENLGIFGDGHKTAGANVKIRNTFNVRVERVQIENCLRCFDIGPANNGTTLRDVIAAPNQPASDYGIYWHSPGDGKQRSDVLTLDNVVIEGQWSNATGILWEGFANTMVASHLRILHMDFGMRITNPAHSASFYPSFLNAFDLEMEGFKTRALSIEAGADFKIVGSDINNLSGAEVQGHRDDQAIRIYSDAGASITRGIQISASRIGDCQSNGVWSDARDLQLTNISLFSTSLAGSGAASAIRLGPASHDVQLTSVMAEEFGGAARAAHGLQIDAGATNVQVTGLDASFATGAAVFNQSASPSVILQGIIERGGASWSQSSPVLRVTPGSLPTSPSEGVCAWERATHKLECYDGAIWRPVW